MVTTRRVNPSFYGWLLLIALATFAVHEAAHWLTGLALGHEMTVSLNSSAPIEPVSTRDAMLISAAGPLITLLGGIIAFIIVHRRRSLIAYGVLYFAVFMRFMAAVMSLFHPNDEARISLMLGWGALTLPILVIGVLGALTWIASRRLHIGWKTNLLAYLACTLAVTLIVGLDQFVIR